MSINQMDKTVQEYKAATNISIQVRAELALFLNDIYPEKRLKNIKLYKRIQPIQL